MAKSRGRKLADIIVTSGADIAGTLSFDGGSTSADLSFADSDKATFGDASDLQIYHDGSNSFISDTGTGDLYIRASNTLRLQNSAGQLYAFGFNGGEFALYHNNAQKLATTSSGVTITGSMVATTSVVDNVTAKTSSGNIAFKNNSGSEKMRLTDGGDLLVGKTSASFSTAGFEFRQSSAAIFGRDGGEPLVLNRITSDGGILQFRKDNSVVGSISVLNSNNLTITCNTADHGGLQFGTHEITPMEAGVDSQGTINLGSANAKFSNLYLSDELKLSNGSYIEFGDNGTSIYGSNSLDVMFFKTTNSERMRINSSGDWMVSNTVANVASNYSTQGGCGWIDSDHHFEIATTTNRSALEVSRNNANQGGIITFRQQATVIGDIGSSNSGSLTINARNTGNMIFQIGTAEKMRLNSSGYLGIGTTSPASHLDVVGSMRLRTAAGYYIYNASNQFRAAFHDNGSMTRIFADGNGSTAHMTFNGGNVGINTTAPDSKLTVYNDTTGITGLVKLWTSTANNTAADGGAIEWVGSADKTAVGAKIAATRVAAGAFMDLRFYTGRNTDSDHEKMRILTDGKVGIGTTAPTTAKLVVQGADAGDLLHLHGVTGTNTRGLKISLATGGATNQIVNFDSMQANGILAFKTAGTERMRIHDGGNVGIGTTSPTSILHIVGSSAKTRIQDSSNNYALDLQMSSSIGKISTSADMALRPGGVESVRLKSDGKVGIGTSSPQALLHLNSGTDTYFIIGTTNGTADGRIQFRNSAGTDAGGLWYNTSGNRMMFRTNSAERMRIDGNGKLIINDSGSHTDDLLQIETPASGGGHGIQIRRNDANGDQQIGRILFGNNTDTDLAQIAAKTDNDSNAGDSGALFFSTQPTGGSLTERMRITSSGSVGIGTTSPTGAKLHVAGGIKGTDLIAHDSTGINLQTDEGTKRLVVTDAGNIGIGETIPTEKLHVGGNIKMQASTAIVTYQNAANTWNIGLDAADASFKFKDGTDERIRIDNSGNVLVGTTTAAPQNFSSGSGTQISDGYVAVARGGSLAFFNRISTDGDLVELKKNGSAVGSIGTYSGDMTIGTTDVALRFDDNVSALIPWNVSTNASNSAAIGLGYSTVKFTDLHLSGTAYIGEKVGIGTSNPTSALTVRGAGSSGSQKNTISFGNSGWGGPLAPNAALDGGVKLALFEGGTQKVQIGMDGSARMWLSSCGSGANGVDIYTGASNTTAPSLRFRIDQAGLTNLYAGLAVTGNITNSGYIVTGGGSIDTSASMGGQSPKLTVNGYASLGGLRINGADSSNTLYKTGSAFSISMGDGSAINLKNTSGTARQASGHWEVLGGKQLRAYRSGDSAYGSLYMDTSERLYIYNSWAGKNVILDRDGNFLVNTTTQYGKITIQTNNNTGLHIRQTSTSVNQIPAIIRQDYVTGGQTGKLIRFEKGTGAEVGSVTATVNATAYNTSSDQRLKDNIVDAPSSSDDIDAIQVRSFDWKVDGSHQKYGMVAQELQSVAPEAVTAPEDPEEMRGIDYSKLVPMLVKEIQSLRARVAELEGE